MSKKKRDVPEDDAQACQSYVAQLLAHQDDLRAFIHSLLPNSPVADDVLQNTNLVLWKKRNSFKEGTNFHAWAFKIARIQVQHQYDRAKRETRLVFSESLLEHVASAAKTNAPRERNLTILEGCMEKLTEKQREIVNARYTPDKSLEQHAENTGATAGSLRISLYRIRAILRQCVENTLTGKTS
ncbi:MAG: sigma-70 family RNA polymerase sigma factor [Verrucomicrobiae bacterium]|nr:sigma-70 family RNA polymerase sigma factor [Verrucomicrobiae bacterium]NNJ44044.1 sigma-70 family RNA polymerase sigma factor [Akkermansiaceae bacterium]